MSGRERVGRRLIAALWFAVLGTGVSAALYGSGAWSVVKALCTLLPGLAAGLSAALLGHRILDPRAVDHGLWAVLHGAAVALGAHVLFAPMFAVGFALTDPTTGPTNVAGLGLAALVIGVQATGVITIPVAAIGGYLLYRLRGVARFETPSPPPTGSGGEA